MWVTKKINKERTETMSAAYFIIQRKHETGQTLFPVGSTRLRHRTQTPLNIEMSPLDVSRSRALTGHRAAGADSTSWEVRSFQL